mmetsp:Transcript_81213/g.218406  ORF Transcript_81213/g.218406 Transcript_81213/m.218406 type:complete len:228 (-) Transcript_81213:51-734(-)
MAASVSSRRDISMSSWMRRRSSSVDSALRSRTRFSWHQARAGPTSRRRKPSSTGRAWSNASMSTRPSSCAASAEAVSRCPSRARWSATSLSTRFLDQSRRAADSAVAALVCDFLEPPSPASDSTGVRDRREAIRLSTRARAASSRASAVSSLRFNPCRRPTRRPSSSLILAAFAAAAASLGAEDDNWELIDVKELETADSSLSSSFCAGFPFREMLSMGNLRNEFSS